MKLLKKIFIIIFIIIFIAVAIFAIYLARQHFIIRKIKDNLANYMESTNFYVKQTTNSDIEKDSVTEYYILGNKSLSKVTSHILSDSKSYEENSKNIFTAISYIEDDKRDMYLEDNIGKYAILGETTQINYSSKDFFFDEFEKDNKWDYIKMLLKLKISTKDYNGKECYLIDLNNAVDIATLTSEDEDINVDNIKYEIYYEKDTGLMLKTNYTDGEIKETKEFEYKFDCVTEDNFVQPNISEYTIINP